MQVLFRSRWPWALLPAVLMVPAILIKAYVAAGLQPQPVLVLVYHRVNTVSGGPVPTVAPRDFARQMDLLARRGYRSIDPQDLLSYIRGNGTFSRPAVLITFDDGWADNYLVARPIMRARGFTATVFVTSGRIGRPGYLSRRQIRDLAADGWRIGAHTVTHRHLPSLPPAEARLEMKRSSAVLSRLIGRPVHELAYPYGDSDSSLERLARAEGFTAGFGTRLGFPHPGQNPLAIRRLTIPNRGGFALVNLATAPWFHPCRLLIDWSLNRELMLKAQAAYSRHLWARRPRLPAPPQTASPRPGRAVRPASSRLRPARSLLPPPRPGK